MELLRLEHQDFVMTIECTKFDAIWRKAKGNVGEEHLTSTYSWSEGVVSVNRLLEDGKSSESILKDVPAPAIFFDNTTILYGLISRRIAMSRVRSSVP